MKRLVTLFLIILLFIITSCSNFQKSSLDKYIMDDNRIYKDGFNYKSIGTEIVNLKPTYIGDKIGFIEDEAENVTWWICAINDQLSSEWIFIEDAGIMPVPGILYKSDSVDTEIMIGSRDDISSIKIISPGPVENTFSDNDFLQKFAIALKSKSQSISNLIDSSNISLTRYVNVYLKNFPGLMLTFTLYTTNDGLKFLNPDTSEVYFDVSDIFSDI